MSRNAEGELKDAMEPLIEMTGDGSATLRSPLHGDTYHSLRGAAGEARHVFIEAGFLQIADSPVRILEMGFGTGLNAWLTLVEAERSGRRVEYTAIELYPVGEEVAARLNYTDDKRFMAMHRAPWGEWTDVADGFRLLKLNSDCAVTEISGTFDLVYWDAFATETQPELWTEEVFDRVFAAMPPNGILVTYSAKGDVRRALQAAGFTVEKLPGALGKRHMLRAQKNYEPATNRE
jgi:tRNA U34 5-methylaminomethyl-2-thiouridine-forming methyltransferase MnmC